MNFKYVFTLIIKDRSKKMKNEIIMFENQQIKLEVNMKDETVWLTQNQMAELFEKDRTVVTKHISNIFKEDELNEDSNVQKMHIANSDKPVNFYSLDVIISVGYRVKSKNGILFRKWANKVLKDYLIKGYAINNKRLEYLEKTVKLLNIASRIEVPLKDNETKEIIKVINNYSNALKLLDDYDHKQIVRPKGTNNNNKILYDDCVRIIKGLRFNNDSDIFGLERDNGLKSIIDSVYQTFDGKDLYSTIEEKCANFLYLVIKNHVFIDGNKRIAATLFIYFLNFYNLLYRDNCLIIDNNTLVAITLLIAQSDPLEKEVLVDLVMNFLIDREV